MEQSPLTFFHIHVEHQAYNQRVQIELGILSHLLDQAIKRDFIAGEYYIVQEFLSSPLFDTTFMNFPKR